MSRRKQLKSEKKVKPCGKPWGFFAAPCDVSADLSGVALAKTGAIRAKGEAKNAIFTLRSQSGAKDGPH